MIHRHQISNQVGGVLVFQRRVENLLCPCVAQLAVAAGREELWKPLNHQLLLTTRHKRPEVTLHSRRALIQTPYRSSVYCTVCTVETAALLKRNTCFKNHLKSPGIITLIQLAKSEIPANINIWVPWSSLTRLHTTNGSGSTNIQGTKNFHLYIS